MDRLTSPREHAAGETGGPLRGLPGPVILGVAGSLRPGATSTKALALALTYARRCGALTRFLDLKDLALPFCNGDKKDPWPTHPDVGRLRQAFRQADGIILAGPEYHGGLSGALKNALDLLDFPHTEGTAFAGIIALGGRSNSNALNNLRDSVRWLHGYSVHQQVAISQARQFDQLDQDTEVALRDLAQGVTRLARLLAAERAVSSPHTTRHPTDETLHATHDRVPGTVPDSIDDGIEDSSGSAVTLPTVPGAAR